ncbi:hypothetical protein EJB05_04005, partial [Eragrostis curvula]
MAAARRSAPVLVLNSFVDMDELTGAPDGEGWTRLKCASKTAYGCGEHGQELVEGLALYARFGDDPVLITSSMAIRMSDAALRRVEEATGVPVNHRVRCGKLEAWGAIEVADQHRIVIGVFFRRDYGRRDSLAYRLLYDKTVMSLSMIQYLPDDVKAFCGIVAVVDPSECAAAKGVVNYELLILARSQKSRPRADVLCICTPPASTAASNGAGPWQTKARRFLGRDPGLFFTDVVFACQGKAFWVDLSQGLVYCDVLRASSSGNDSVDVDFEFVELPQEHLLGFKTMLEDEPRKMSRTMACVDDTVWFACIDRHGSCQDHLVTLWTLDLVERQWTKEMEFPTKMLWALDSFKEAGLPERVFMDPSLTPDGALCVLLAGDHIMMEYAYPPVEDHICSFDLRRKRLVWHAIVHDYHYTDPLIVPSSFFQTLLCLPAGP